MFLKREIISGLCDLNEELFALETKLDKLEKRVKALEPKKRDRGRPRKEK